MTQLIYICDETNVLFSKTDASKDEILKKMEDHQWQFPFRYETPKVLQIDGLFVIYGQSQETLFHLLTPQQIKIVRRLACGESASQIAVAMRISTDTVNYHIKEAKKKLHVDTRNELIALYCRETPFE